MITDQFEAKNKQRLNDYEIIFLSDCKCRHFQKNALIKLKSYFYIWCRPYIAYCTLHNSFQGLGLQEFVTVFPTLSWPLGQGIFSACRVKSVLNYSKKGKALLVVGYVLQHWKYPCPWISRFVGKCLLPSVRTKRSQMSRPLSTEIHWTGQMLSQSVSIWKLPHTVLSQMYRLQSVLVMWSLWKCSPTSWTVQWLSLFCTTRQG